MATVTRSSRRNGRVRPADVEQSTVDNLMDTSATIVSDAVADVIDVPAAVAQDHATDAIAGIVGTGDADAIKLVHDAAVADIVGMVRAKYEDEGTRNLNIGRRTYEHMLWQRERFPSFGSQDFDNLCNRVRDDVRIHVAISPRSIRLGEWVRCHVLRCQVSEHAGSDVADSITFFEYRITYDNALKFSKSDLSAEIRPGWLDFYKSVAADRAAGRRVSSEAFTERRDATAKAIKATADDADPAATAARVASEAIKAKTRAVSKANEAVASSVSDAITGQHLTPESVLSIVENVCKHHGVPVPATIGFDPARCTMEDCELLASSMFAAGKFKEMSRLVVRLSALLATVNAKDGTAK